MTNYIEDYCSEMLGIYIPKNFAESYKPSKWCFKHCEKDSLDILKEGPESDGYWEAWDDILDNAETTCGGKLWQDGHLFVVWSDKAIADLNEHIESQVEYEESHKDAGNNYSHMPAESWVESDTTELMLNLTGPDVIAGKDSNGWAVWGKAWEVDPMGLEPDEISDIALDIFTMESGGIYSPTDKIVLGAYSVGEVEVEIPIEFGDVLSLIEDSLDAYVSNGYAYMSTDCIWYAVVCPDALQQAIADRVYA